jgi:hypothetical protein
VSLFVLQSSDECLQLELTQLSLWHRVLPEKLTGTHLVKKSQMVFKYCLISVLLAWVRIESGMICIISLYMNDKTTGDLKV